MFVIKRLNKNCYERQDDAHPARSPLHCFFYLSQGSVLVDIGDTTYFIQEDDLVIVPAGVAFRVRYYENSKGYMGGFDLSYFNVVKEMDGSLNRSDFLKGWGNPKIQLDKQSSLRISMLLERMTQESELPKPDMEIVKAYLFAFLAETGAVYKKENRQIISNSDTVCNKFFEMLFHNKEDAPFPPVSKMPVTYYAAELNVTPNHLNKVVKNITGKSPSVWIEELIMQEAKRLLHTTSLSLGEIAAMVGIDDQSYFARRFKKHEGISPSIFRSQGK